MKAIDLFCGAGGLTRGLLDAGIDVVAGIDVDESVGRTYEWNNRPTRFVRSDLRTLEPDIIKELFGSTAVEEALLTGCAPCRTFSKQRRNASLRHPDATILGEFGRLVEALHPGWVLIENVPGLATVPGYSTFRRFLRLLNKKGYRVAQGVLNASQYGVPQHRRRYVLIASRWADPSLPVHRYGHQLRPFETVRKWIAHYPPIAAGECHPSIANHASSMLSTRNLQRLRATPCDGGDRRDWPSALELDCHQGRNQSFSDVYGRMWWDRVAPTLTGRCNSVSNGRFGHPEQDRAVSLREAASLQTFPDDYLFFGVNTHIARHIGNAVPVRLAEALGSAVLSATTHG